MDKLVEALRDLALAPAALFWALGVITGVVARPFLWSLGKLRNQFDKFEDVLSQHFRILLFLLGCGGLVLFSVIAWLAMSKPVHPMWVPALGKWDIIRGTKSTIEALQIGVNVFVAIGGALTAYYIFILQRSSEPALDIVGSVAMVGTHGDRHIVKVSTKLSNTGKVKVAIAPYLGKAAEAWAKAAKQAFDDTVTVPASLAIRRVQDAEVVPADGQTAGMMFFNWWDNSEATQSWWKPSDARALDLALREANVDQATVACLRARREAAKTIEVDLVEDYEEGERSSPKNGFFMDPGETYEFNHTFLLPPGLYQVKVSFAGPHFVNDYWSRLEVFQVPQPKEADDARGWRRP